LKELLEHGAIDWADFETAGQETRDLLRQLDADTSLRGLVEAATRAIAVDEDGRELVLVLHEAPEEAMRLEVRLFRNGRVVEPRAAGSCSVRVLAGEYRLTWYGELDGLGPGLTPLLTRLERPGDTYSLRHGTVHSIGAEADTITLVLSETSGDDAGEEGTAELYEEAVAALERLTVI
jgi:hypothetical protein